MGMILLYYLYAAALLAVNCKLHLDVDTTHGPVRGHQMTWSDGSVTNAWQGIPFGEPPLGDLRWRAPKTPTPWKDTLNCTSIKNYCVQSGGDGTEDCLYLNVYSTGNPTNAGPYPVMYYVYGGGLMSGAANMDYGGFVNHAGNGEGIIVVEVSYRLNILGFLAVAELSEEQGGVSGNYGIQDQILGLQWVRDNIAKFNGDPNLVTIAGQSSGGTSVFSLMSAPATRGLFHRAISLSGSPNISLPMADAERQNAHLVVEAGCSGGSSAADVVKCLRGKGVDELLYLIPDAWDTPGLFGLPLTTTGEHWEALVIVDGVTIPHPFDEALALGNVTSNVPFMVGAMGQECDGGPEKRVEGLSAEAWRRYLVDYFAPWDEMLARESKAEEPREKTVGATIYELYEDDLTVDGNAQKAYDNIMSDYGQNCANVRLSQSALLGKYSAPIYHFVNNYHLSSTLGGPAPEYVINYAFHVLDYLMAIELWSAFDRNGSPYVPDTRDLEGAQLIQSLWYAFMVTGDPSAAGVSRVYPREIPEWRAFSDTPDWPASFNTYVIQSDAAQGAFTETVANYHSDKCDYFRKIGISNKEFWWCN